MQLTRSLMGLAAGYGALQGRENRPSLPFNDPSFQPTHETPVMYVHGINSRAAAFRHNGQHLRDNGFWVWGSGQVRDPCGTATRLVQPGC